MRGIISGVRVKSIRLNDRKLVYLLLTCDFLFSLAMDYRQKRDVRSNLCVAILIIRVN